ncbi:aminopeptidase P family protein [bacterium]|nr:aminopeptidase P family protein [bacterium]
MLPDTHHTPFFVPESDISDRIKRLQKALSAEGAGVAWMQHPADLYYFTGSVQDGVLLIPAAGDPVYYVKMSLKRAEVESPLSVEPFPGRKGLVKRAREMAGGGPPGLSLDVTPAAVYALIKTIWKEAAITDISGPIRTVKMVKSGWEIEQIKGAALQAETLLRDLPDIVNVGVTELQAAALLEKRLRELGHSGTMRIRGAAETHSVLQFSAGDSACYPTNFNGPLGSAGIYPASGTGPAARVIEPDQTVMLDFVTSHNGYHTDFTRTYYTGGTIPEPVLEAHRFCLDVLELLEELTVPGANCQDVYNEVAAQAEERGLPPGFMGFGENQVRFFGHGIGTELDEMPVIADRVDLELAAGMVLAMEPKAFLPGIGGVGAEDTFLITGNGCEPFLNIPRDIQLLT